MADGLDVRVCYCSKAAVITSLQSDAIYLSGSSIRQLHCLGLICQFEAAVTMQVLERVCVTEGVLARDKGNDRRREGRQTHINRDATHICFCHSHQWKVLLVFLGQSQYNTCMTTCMSKGL